LDFPGVAQGAASGAGLASRVLFFFLKGAKALPNLLIKKEFYMIEHTENGKERYKELFSRPKFAQTFGARVLAQGFL
jgi:methylase of polypeptide subunit release factors